MAEWGNYVGAKRCQVCHQEAYDIWAKGPHARALMNLTGQQKQDFRCRQCHTMLADAPMEHLRGIQCESCHGPGRYYAESYIMQDEELRKDACAHEPVLSTLAPRSSGSTPCGRRPSCQAHQRSTPRALGDPGVLREASPSAHRSGTSAALRAKASPACHSNPR